MCFTNHNKSSISLFIILHHFIIYKVTAISSTLSIYLCIYPLDLLTVGCHRCPGNRISPLINTYCYYYIALVHLPSGCLVQIQMWQLLMSKWMKCPLPKVLDLQCLSHTSKYTKFLKCDRFLETSIWPCQVNETTLTLTIYISRFLPPAM